MSDAGGRHLTGLTDPRRRRSVHRYKGFTILARPYQLTDSKQWTVDLEIRRRGLRHAFSGEQRFRTESEAEAECARWGRQIIDGTIPGWAGGGVPNERREWSALFYAPPGAVELRFVVAGMLVLFLSAMFLLRESLS